MKSFKGLARENYRQMGMTVAGLMLGLLAMLAFSGPASAATVECSGKLKANKKSVAANAMTYSFKCTEEILAYSIISNRQVDYFTTEIPVFVNGQVASEESFFCEGAIPDNGFGCYGRMSARSKAEGELATVDKLCEANHQPRFWLVVLTTEIGTRDRPYPLTSQPYPLGGTRCRTLNAEKKARARVKTECARVKRADTVQERSKARKRCAAAKKALNRS